MTWRWPALLLSIVLLATSSALAETSRGGLDLPGWSALDLQTETTSWLNFTLSTSGAAHLAVFVYGVDGQVLGRASLTRHDTLYASGSVLENHPTAVRFAAGPSDGSLQLQLIGGVEARIVVFGAGQASRVTYALESDGPSSLGIAGTGTRAWYVYEDAPATAGIAADAFLIKATLQRGAKASIPSYGTLVGSAGAASRAHTVVHREETTTLSGPTGTRSCPCTMDLFGPDALPQGNYIIERHTANVRRPLDGSHLIAAADVVLPAAWR